MRAQRPATCDHMKSLLVGRTTEITPTLRRFSESSCGDLTESAPGGDLDRLRSEPFDLVVVHSDAEHAAGDCAEIRSIWSDRDTTYLLAAVEGARKDDISVLL